MFRIKGLNKNLLSIAWNGVSFSPEKFELKRVGILGVTHEFVNDREA